MANNVPRTAKLEQVYVTMKKTPGGNVACTVTASDDRDPVNPRLYSNSRHADMISALLALVDDLRANE